MSKLTVFNHLFPDNNVEFIKINSLHLETQKKYDFIHIDGNHYHPYVENDILKSIEMSHTDTIISVDDYEKLGCDVDSAIKKHLLGQHEFVPFLIGDSSVFFHHVSRDAGEFLDQWLQNDSRNFLTFSNENFYYDFQVLKTSFVSQLASCSHMPDLFNDSLTLFRNALKFYNI